MDQKSHDGKIPPNSIDGNSSSPDPGFRLFRCSVVQETYEVPVDLDITWCPACGYKYCCP